MRKLGTRRVRDRWPEQREADLDETDTRPGRVSGAIITERPSVPDINLEALFAQPANRPTLSGSTKGQADDNEEKTLSLWDGTKITFVS